MQIPTHTYTVIGYVNADVSGRCSRAVDSGAWRCQRALSLECRCLQRSERERLCVCDYTCLQGAEEGRGHVSPFTCREQNGAEGMWLQMSADGKRGGGHLFSGTCWIYRGSVQGSTDACRVMSGDSVMWL